MPKYEVGKTWYFKEHSRHFNAGEQIDLDEDAAEAYSHNEPGLLKPVRQTAQAAPTVVRSSASNAAAVVPAAPKPRAAKAKK